MPGLLEPPAIVISPTAPTETLGMRRRPCAYELGKLLEGNPVVNIRLSDRRQLGAELGGRVQAWLDEPRSLADRPQVRHAD